MNHSYAIIIQNTLYSNITNILVVKIWRKIVYKLCILVVTGQLSTENAEELTPNTTATTPEGNIYNTDIV